MKSAEQSYLSKRELQITTFISIAIVTLILLVVFPLLTRVLQQEYNVVTFFNYLREEAIQRTLEKVLKY